jgi:hypothetical protein
MWRRPVALVNARVVTPQGEAQSIRFARRVLSCGEAPRPGDFVHDVEGAWVLPGLINAHDHLELNHYGTQVGSAPYRNVMEWVDDMRPRLHADAGLAAGRARPLAARIFAGGLKNLLSGVTLVAHHNPIYPGLHRASPVRVLSRFGWAHSFAMAQAPVGARGEPMHARNWAGSMPQARWPATRCWCMRLRWMPRVGTWSAAAAAAWCGALPRTSRCSAPR